MTTLAGRTPATIGNAEVEVEAANREILTIRSSPGTPRLQELVGVRAGGYLRAALDEVCPEEKAAGTPLYLLLDDVAGTTLVAQWAFSDIARNIGPTTGNAKIMPVMRSICIGFRPGSSALDDEGRARADQNATRVQPLRNELDPRGWHAFPQLEGVNFRRARRIDVWREGGKLKVESHFQDSAGLPGTDDRMAVHEYLISATVGADGLLEEIDARPGTLPYAACRVAPLNLSALIGAPVRSLRDEVLRRLKDTLGCTHLNDMARSLAEVPILARNLSTSI